MYFKYSFKFILLMFINISLAFAVPIDNIDVSGTYFNRNTVISASGLAGKSEINEEDIETAKGNIMKTGLFINVDINIQDTTLNISVLETSMAYAALII
jgi:outer membrane protein assembly factor BamA